MKFKYIGLILLVEVILLITNYVSGTYLVGWDNVYPELNFSANLQRNIFAIWQEYRGLGVIDGMAHAANLPHTLFIFFLSFILPQSLLRYFFTFLMHFLGGLGAYLLLKKLTKQEGLLPLFGAFFYQLNLATIQMFYTPLEVFSTHFGFLPFLLFLLLEYLNQGRKKILILFALFTFLSTPQAHVPSVFLVYFLAAFTIIFFYSIFNKQTIKQGLCLLLLIFLLNAFWGLPYIYTAIHDSSTIVNSKINIMSTDNVVLRNKAFGDLFDVALLRGFSLDYMDFQPQGKNDYMMNAWKSHIDNPFVFTISIIFFLFAFYGVLKAVIKKNTAYYPFIFLFVISFLILGSDIPILSLFSEALKRFVPLFYDAFRFTFTKFSILYAFSYAIFLVYGVKSLLDILQNKIFSFIILSLLSLALFMYSYPAFRGEFLYRNLRLNIPPSYFQLIDYFKNQDKNTRIATLPQPSYWNWSYTNWGFRGSGFIWYALPQASLDGAFYPWSKENENYYWEMSKAIYSSNREAFENVFDKYQIQWLIIDKNVISPFSPKAVYVKELEDMIKKSIKFNKAVGFGAIDVYQVKLSTPANNFIFIAKDLPKVAPSFNFNDNDLAYSEYKNYISVGNENSSNEANVYYPFRSLFTGRGSENSGFKIEDKGEYFSFTTKIPKDLIGGKIILPPIIKEEFTEIDAKKLTQSKELYPALLLDNSQIKQALPDFTEGIFEARVPKISGYYSYDKTGETINIRPNDCGLPNKGILKNEKVNEEKKELNRFININSANCIDIDLSNLSQRIGYLIGIESRNVEGNSLLFTVVNKMSERADIEIYLPKSKKITTSYFITPPMEQYGLGYSLHLGNQSIGRVKTVNDLGRITINPIPYRFLTSIKIIKGQIGETKISSNDIVVNHPNPTYYSISIKQYDNETIVLSQSFDPGWKAYEIENSVMLNSFQNDIYTAFPFLFGTELKEHVMVNNWANGWLIDSSKFKVQSSKLTIVFWPQYLEYLGFFLLSLSFLFVLRAKH